MIQILLTGQDFQLIETNELLIPLLNKKITYSCGFLVYGKISLVNLIIWRPTKGGVNFFVIKIIILINYARFYFLISCNKINAWYCRFSFR